ncbi:hypothetical protein BS47DRAFT_1463383 [Hydnum rufescens UP504]|uniref:Uncharacterized protein n=1 Tax=Hydnum rufescens UP504 TaxID=1448309 RepID=A0A9P6AWC4_9AGAM|nr:hypothetical protein BS47DRAFT_1463383 [Hydnum rufescens UP504]
MRAASVEGDSTLAIYAFFSGTGLDAPDPVTAVIASSEGLYILPKLARPYFLALGPPQKYRGFRGGSPREALGYEVRVNLKMANGSPAFAWHQGLNTHGLMPMSLLVESGVGDSQRLGGYSTICCHHSALCGHYVWRSWVNGTISRRQEKLKGIGMSTLFGASYPSAEGNVSRASSEIVPECTHVPRKIRKTQKALESSEYIEAEASRGHGKGSKGRGTSSAAQDKRGCEDDHGRADKHGYEDHQHGHAIEFEHGNRVPPDIESPIDNDDIGLQEGASPSGSPIDIDPRTPLGQPLFLRDDTVEIGPLSDNASQLLCNQYFHMDLDSQDIKIPISDVIDQNDDQLSISYEDYDGGGPRSDQWCAACLHYLRILLRHLPDIGSVASLHDYLGTTVFTLYKDWRQSFGIDSFGEFVMDDLQFGPAFKEFSKAAFGDRHIAEAAIKNFSADIFENVQQVAQSLSIRDAQHMDGSVFWGTGGAVAMIPDIIQSVFIHCPITHDLGLINKFLVDVMNMAK